MNKARAYRHEGELTSDLEGAVEPDTEVVLEESSHVIRDRFPYEAC